MESRTLPELRTPEAEPEALGGEPGDPGLGRRLLNPKTIASFAQTKDAALARQQEGRIIDAHVHLWQLPRDAAPMNDAATFPTGCCGSVPWMEVDRMPADYDARVGGPKVDKLVLIESSVGVTPDKIIQSNLWMLQTAAADGKILSVVGNLDVTQAPTTFAQQLAQISANKQFVGLRVGGLFQPNTPAAFSNLRPNFWQLTQHWQLLPWAVATAALNAANEEFQFRCVPLAHLRNVLPLREGVWLTAIFFGLAHYFGQPSGWLGVAMATIAGFIWAKSMLETRGVGWAFGIHFVQDLVIFYFLAMSFKP